MKRIILLTIFALSLASCASQVSISGPNPCKDSLMLALKRRDLNSLSIREYDYMRQKEDECQRREAIETVNSVNEGISSTIWGMLGLSVLATIAYIIIRGGGAH